MAAMMRKEVATAGYENVGGAWIHPAARIGQDVVIDPGAVIGKDVTLGDRCWVGPCAVILGPSTIGCDNRFFPSSVVGAEPQDITYAGEPTRLEIGDRNVFREGVTVHRGTAKGAGVTRIGDDNLLMAGAHVGHDSIVDHHVILANSVLIAGHCHIGERVYMAGRVSIVQFTTVGRFAFITGLSGTTMDVEPFLSHTGVPARPRNVNAVGLRRAGFSRDQITSLKEAYKILFTNSSKGGDDLDRSRDELGKRGFLSDEVSELLEFMRRSRAGRYGRMLQGDRPGPEDEPTGYANRWTESGKV